MNRGNIPGYYYDEEKKKYFAIQANHIAPPNAKYNKTNVKLEKRATKKRKLEEKHQKKLRQQTVVPAKLLRQPLLVGAGLQREIGSKTYASHHAQRDTAFVHNLGASETRIEISGYPEEGLRLTDAHYLSEASLMLLAVRHSEISHAIYSYEWEDGWGRQEVLQYDRPLHAFHDPINSLQHVLLRGTPFVVATTPLSDAVHGNLYIGPIKDFDHHHDYICNIGKRSDVLWDCKADASNLSVACAGDFGVQVYSLEDMKGLTELSSPNNDSIYAVDWLNRSTLALGTKSYDTYHDMYLWDIRAHGMALRLQRADKISGIYTPDDSGHNLVVTSSHGIGLYDLRNTSTSSGPLLSLDHKSGVTCLHLSILNGNLLAAEDCHSKIQIYSLRTGKHIRTMRPYGQVQGRQTGPLLPRWQEDQRGGPFLQACHDNTIQYWS